MSTQPALKHLYLSISIGSIISVLGSIFTTRNTVTTEDLDRKLKPIADTLAHHEKLHEKADKKLNDIQRTLNRKTRCFVV
jgi:hypothetical protein